MNNPKIWLSSPHMGGSELKYIHEAFDENWVAPLGPNVNGFEEDLKQFLGGNVEVAALSAGTAALHLALIILGIQKNDGSAPYFTLMPLATASHIVAWGKKSFTLAAGSSLNAVGSTYIYLVIA